MNCECNRCELGSVGHYTQWTCEYTGEHKTYEEQTCILTAENMHTHDDCSLHEHEWTEDGTDGMVTARVTLQIVIDVPDGISIGKAVKQLVCHHPYYDAYCVEILSSEPTNKSAKELTEMKSYINQQSKTNQEEVNE